MYLKVGIYFEINFIALLLHKLHVTNKGVKVLIYTGE